MQTRDAVFLILGAALAVPAGSSAVVLFLRGRRSPHLILWRGRLLPAPRTRAWMHTFATVGVVLGLVSHLLFEPGSRGYTTMATAGLIFFALSGVMGVSWMRRRDQAQPPAHLHNAWWWSQD